MTLAAYYSPPPQSSPSRGEEVILERCFDSVSSPLEGEGQGGGCQRIVRVCLQRTRDTSEKTRRTLRNVSGNDCAESKFKMRDFAGKHPSGLISSISFARTQNSSSNWMVGSMPTIWQRILGAQYGLKRAAIELFGSGITMSWKISKVCSRLLQLILTRALKEDLPPSQALPFSGLWDLNETGSVHA